MNRVRHCRTGAFVTPIFQKQDEAADPLRSSGYAPASEIPQNLRRQLTSSPLNPQEVADCVVNLIELPAGERPLRVTVGLPVDSYYLERTNQSGLNAEAPRMSDIVG
jgi:hypothetical protein